MIDIPKIFLFIFSAFSINLVLQCALGIKGIAESKNPEHGSNLIKSAVIFTTITFMWLVFYKLHYFTAGVFVFVILFPICYMVYEGLEYFIFRKLMKKDTGSEYAVNFSGGICAAAVFICLNIAENFLEALALSFGFTLGVYLVFIIIGEIRKRAILEAVPQFLRGKPLVLISMGMLSLVFTTASLLLFRVIGGR